LIEEIRILDLILKKVIIVLRNYLMQNLYGLQVQQKALPRL